MYATFYFFQLCSPDTLSYQSPHVEYFSDTLSYQSPQVEYFSAF